MATTESVPAALNSSSPTLAIPNHGLSSLASRVAATRSSPSRARSNRSRRCGGAFHSVGMGPSYQVVQMGNVVTAAPGGQLGQHPDGRPRAGERGGAHLDRGGGGGPEFG